MKEGFQLTRRTFLGVLGVAASPVFAGLATPSSKELGILRDAIVDSPVTVGLHRARVFTRVFQENEDQPWMVRKAMALREYFRTVPLYLRPHDRIAGSIAETPGAMPVIVELGIAENRGYTNENPSRIGYMDGQISQDIWDYWKHRNLWGKYRAANSGVEEEPDGPDVQVTYKFISNQGHLSPAYSDLLKEGLGGILGKVEERRQKETDSEKLAFLKAAEYSLKGIMEWAERYSKFLDGEAARCPTPDRAADLREMARIAKKVAIQPPGTFREAIQLVWFVHQAIHIEGHGYSCSPDHIDQILYPFYQADRKAGRLSDREVIALCENFALKMADNTFWGPEHHLTQGLCLGGSTAEGKDLTNRLSWLFLEGSTNMALAEPLIWIRWHSNLDQEFFDFGLSRLAKATCFPLMWNDNVVPAGLMKLGVEKEDAYNYIAVGCNELAVPGQFYFNPGAQCNYLKSLELALTSGRGYQDNIRLEPVAPPVSELQSFDDFTAAFGAYVRRSIKQGFETNIQIIKAQIEWGQTPLTSCFFEGCIEHARDMIAGTKYNILSCGGIFFANAVDSLAAIREVVFEQKAATLEEVAQACRDNFERWEQLRGKLWAAPKHGNDDPRLDDLIRLVERLRDEPLKEICRDPRDGSQFGNCHVVRSASVRTGLITPATPDGRLAGKPLASSVAASIGCERSGPTALLNSVCKLNPVDSWQSGYQVNLRFQGNMISKKSNRDKLRALLNVYFSKGGQQLQINAIDSNLLRAAQKDPDQYRDLVVRIAGFSEFFVNLTPEMQEELIERTAHAY